MTSNYFLPSLVLNHPSGTILNLKRCTVPSDTFFLSSCAPLTIELHVQFLQKVFVKGAVEMLGNKCEVYMVYFPLLYVWCFITLKFANDLYRVVTQSLHWMMHPRSDLVDPFATHVFSPALVIWITGLRTANLRSCFNSSYHCFSNFSVHLSTIIICQSLYKLAVKSGYVAIFQLARECREGGIISPSTCEYIKDWLSFWTFNTNE